VPAAADVLYGVDVDDTTGTCYVPAAADVRYGTNVDDTTGTCYVPAAADVEFGVNVDDTTGTFVVPAEADVKDGVTYGAAAEFEGTYVPTEFPDEGDVRDGITYGMAGELEGTLELPDVTEVVSGVQYGADGTEFTGTAIAVVPSDPGEATGWLIAYDNEGQAVAGIKLTLTQTAPPAGDEDGHAYDATPRTLTSGPGGLVYATGLFVDAEYTLRRGKGAVAELTVPDEEEFEFPTVLGSAEYVFATASSTF
jgi:hypothetical protein